MERSRINRTMVLWLAVSLSLNAGQAYRSTFKPPADFARPAPVAEMNVRELRVESKRLGLPAYQRDGTRLKRADLVEQIEKVERSLRALSKRIDEGEP